MTRTCRGEVIFERGAGRKIWMAEGGITGRGVSVAVGVMLGVGDRVGVAVDLGVLVSVGKPVDVWLGIGLRVGEAFVVGAIKVGTSVGVTGARGVSACPAWIVSAITVGSCSVGTAVWKGLPAVRQPLNILMQNNSSPMKTQIRLKRAGLDGVLPGCLGCGTCFAGITADQCVILPYCRMPAFGR
jgi:hypothetical protein